MSDVPPPPFEVRTTDGVTLPVTATRTDTDDDVHLVVRTDDGSQHLVAASELVVDGATLRIQLTAEQVAAAPVLGGKRSGIRWTRKPVKYRVARDRDR